MKFTLALIVINKCYTLSLGSLSGDCRNVYNGTYFNNNCYTYSHIRRTWDNLMNYCISLGGGKYKSHTVHVLSSEIYLVLQLLAGDLKSQWTYSYFGTWLGLRDGLQGSDPSKTFWKHRWYTDVTTYQDYPANQMYFIRNIPHYYTDPYEQSNVGLAYFHNTMGGIEPLQTRIGTAPLHYTYYGFCQINGNNRQFERVAMNMKLIKQPTLQSSKVKSLNKCSHVCASHPICIAFNYADNGLNPSAESGTICVCVCPNGVTVGGGGQFDKNFFAYHTCDVTSDFITSFFDPPSILVLRFFLQPP